MATLKVSTTYTRLFKLVSSTDHITAKTGATATVNLSKAGAAFGAAAGAVTEVASGWYKVALTTADTGTLGDLAYYITASGADDTDFVDQVTTQILGDTITANVTQLLGTAWLTPGVAGTPDVNAKQLGAAPVTATTSVTFSAASTVASTTNITAGTMTTTTNLTNLPAITANWLTAAGTAADFTTEIQAGLATPTNITAGTITTVTNVTTVNGLAANVITAASIATGAIDADALASDAATEIRSLASGTSDSGTTTTMVDAARTEADTDYWRGQVIVFTSGTLLGQARLITGFNAATDTITFSPATTVAAGTHTYEIWPGSDAILAQLTHTSAVIPTVTTLTGHTPQTGDSFARIGVAGAGLTAIDLPNQTMDITGNITGNLSGSVGSVTGAVGSVTGLTNATIADAVWDEPTSGHTTAGTTGKALTDAGSSGDPWTTALPGVYGAGTAGKIIGDNINATISGRMATYTQPTGFLAATFPAGTVANTTNITGGTITTVGSVTGAVGSVTGLTAANLDTTISSRATPAQVNTEVLDVLSVDTFAEPGQGTPAATTTLSGKIGYLFKNWRNRQTQTATTWSLFNDDAVTVDQKATVADDAVTASKTEITTGP